MFLYLTRVWDTCIVTLCQRRGYVIWPPKSYDNAPGPPRSYVRNGCNEHCMDRNGVSFRYRSNGQRIGLQKSDNFPQKVTMRSSSPKMLRSQACRENGTH